MHPLLPLLILLTLLCVLTAIAYIIYTTATEIAQKTSKKMEEKNVVFSKDGMRVGVQEVRTERYVDGQKRCVCLLSFGMGGAVG